MSKFLLFFSKLVLALAFLSVFGWVVKHVTLGDRDFGVFNGPIKSLSGFPDLFKQTAKEIKSLPGTFIKTPKTFKPINELESDVLALVAFSDSTGNRTVNLQNFRTDEVRHSWSVKLEERFGNHDRIMDPLMLEDKSLFYSINGQSGVKKIDSESNLVWRQDSVVHHHSLNIDSEENLWMCSYNPSPKGYCLLDGKYDLDYLEMKFIDNGITKLNSSTGEIMFHKSMAEILVENNLEHMILQSGNSEDPIHINDVQPALSSTDFYQKGDVFISSRNLSALFHYRPETNELLNVFKGPFSCQHDVDFLNETALVWFNNNSSTLNSKPKHKSAVPDQVTDLEINNSNIIQFDFKTGEYTELLDSVFNSNHIFTFTEGMQEFISEDIVFIEEQNSGYLWILEGDKVVYKNVLASHHEGYHHLPNWIRIVK